MIAEDIGLVARFKPELPGLSHGEIRELFRSVMMHHGRPVDEPQNVKPAISAFIEEAFRLIPCGGPVLRSAPSEEQVAVFSWALAGLIVLADWIGSNEDYFEYRERVEDLPAYWICARRQAELALTKAGILPIAAHNQFNPLNLLPKTPGKQTELSPLQKAAAALPIADGPNLARKSASPPRFFTSSSRSMQA
jgi:CRISPR-associated endonuclease/helicase Cas3